MERFVFEEPRGNITLTGTSELVSILYVVVELVVMVIVLLGNVLTVCAVCKYPPLRTVTHVYTVSLAVADLLVGLSMPYHVALHLDPTITDSFMACMVKYWTISFPAGASVSFLLAIAIDRYLAIQKPFFYHQYVTMRTVGVVTVCIWLYSFLMTSLPFYGWHTWTSHKICDIIEVLDHLFIGLIFVGHILVFLLVIGCLYTVIFRTALKHQRKIRALTITDEETCRESRTMKRDTKAARTFCLVVGMYAICLLPFCIVILVEVGLASNRPPALDYVRLVAYFLAFLNSGINPFIYAWRIHLFRQAYKRLLGCKKTMVENPISLHAHFSQSNISFSGHI